MLHIGKARIWQGQDEASGNSARAPVAHGMTPTTCDLKQTTGWHYARPLAWPIVHVRFDAMDRYESHEYDY